jgi:putative addiction module killer protein
MADISDRVLTAPSEAPGAIAKTEDWRKDMLEVRETEVYARWFARLRDIEAKARIQTRIRRLALGNPGDVGAVGQGVSELRIDYGPGYRVYFVQQGNTLVILLAGGDKSTQQQDIRIAIELAHGL